MAETEALVARLVADSAQYRVQRKADPKDPLWQAERHAAGLADDIPFFNVWMLKIIVGYAERGDVQEAAYLADQLPGAGSALAHSELALIHARKSEVQEAEAHLTAARAGLSYATPKQASIVRSRCAQALHWLKRGDDAAAAEAQIDELELLNLHTHLQEDGIGPGLLLAQAEARLAGIKAQGIDEARCRFLLASAERHFKEGNIAAGLPFLPVIGRLASTNGLPPAQHVLLELARVAWQAGQVEDARKALNLFLKCCEAYADHAEWKAPYLADAAELLLNWQKQDEARVWLKLAESGLPKVFVMDAPAAILAVGQQMDRLNGAGEGDRFALMAAQAGMRHPHPRVQAGTALQICLFYSKVQRPVPASLTRLLNPEITEEGK